MNSKREADLGLRAAILRAKMEVYVSPVLKKFTTGFPTTATPSAAPSNL
jgi:hypothetical protein